MAKVLRAQSILLIFFGSIKGKNKKVFWIELLPRRIFAIGLKVLEKAFAARGTQKSGSEASVFLPLARSGTVEKDRKNSGMKDESFRW